MHHSTLGISALTLTLGLAAGCATASNQGPRIVGDHIELGQRIHFASNKATIEEDSHGLLNNLAGLLKANPDIVKVRIHGHTDNSGDPDYNLTLSEQRADSVRTFLVSRGVETALETKGLGQTEPTCSEDTDACHAKNRRVEFLIERE